MATKIAINDFMIYKANTSLAKSYLDTNFASFSQADQDTWKNNSPFNTPSATKDPTGIYAFYDYFLGDFGANTNSNVTYFATATLAAGTGNDYSSRASRLPWSTT